MKGKEEGYTGKRNIVRKYTRYVRGRIRWNYTWAKSSLWFPVFNRYFPGDKLCCLDGYALRIDTKGVCRAAKTRKRLIQIFRLYQ